MLPSIARFRGAAMLSVAYGSTKKLVMKLAEESGFQALGFV